MIRTCHVLAALAAIGFAAAAAPSPALAASKCIQAGGVGTGVIQNFAEFMAEAALKNSAKAWGGDAVKISKVDQACKWEGLFTCTAKARACK